MSGLRHQNADGGKQFFPGSPQIQVATRGSYHPRMTWRGVLLAAGGWIIYAFLNAIPLKSSAGMPFGTALYYEICQSFLMAVLSIPVWLLIISRMDSSRWWWKFGTHIIIAPIYTWAIYKIVIEGAAGSHAGEAIGSAYQWILLFYLLSYVLQFAIYHGVVTMKRLHQREKEAIELLALKREQELATLRSQINPHFLFNALNSISAMASHNAEKTRVMIAQLGDLLRYATETSKKEFVPLRDELAFVKSYLALESKRLGNRLQVEVDVPAQALDVLVPPMILQPLVENATKHGIEPSEKGGKVIVSIAIAAKTMSVSVRDAGVGFRGTAFSSAEGGIGLKNTDARLRKLFGEQAGLWINTPQSGGFEVGFTLPMNEPER